MSCTVKDSVICFLPILIVSLTLMTFGFVLEVFLIVSIALLTHSVPIRGVRGTFRRFGGRDRIRTCANFGEKVCLKEGPNC